MIILVLIITYFLYVLYVYKKTESFISSNEFNGAKKGYVFKNDKQGIGYYLDKP
jgi:hypothetical protein